MNFTGSVAPVAGPTPAPAPHAERDGPDRAESQTPEVTQGHAGELHSATSEFSSGFSRRRHRHMHAGVRSGS